MNGGAERLVASLDPAWFGRQRWFAGKARSVDTVELVDGFECEGGTLAIVELRFAAGPPERYTVIDGAPWSELLAGGGIGAFVVRGAGHAPGGERPLGIDQSNTSVVLGAGLLVKCYRRLWPGPHPEVELLSFLGGRVSCVPRVHAWVGHREGSDEWALATVQEFVPGAVDGWAWGRELVEAVVDGAEAADFGAALGGVTAEVHVALAALGTSVADVGTAWLARASEGLARAREPLNELFEPFAPAIESELAVLAGAGETVLARVHGDLHVGQILRTPGRLHVVDFEGEPTRPPEERRVLDTPLRDVASMLRSLEHLPRWVLRDRPGALPAALAWAARQRELFLAAYQTGVGPTFGAPDLRLLRGLEVEKEVYELVYAATYLPEWEPVALGALDALLASSPT